MPKPGIKDITEFNLSQVNLEDIDYSNIPELDVLVVTVCYESVPPEYKFANIVNYFDIKQKVLVPFFEKKMRLMRENNFFTVDQIQFKILSTSNRQ